MIKVTILYPKAQAGRFDADYYVGKHMPMSIARLGPAMRSITVERGFDPGDPWPAATFHAMASFVCESREAYEAAFFPHMAELQADMANYTDIEPIIQVSEIALEG